MMRLVKLCVIGMCLALLGGCASVSDGPLPTFKNIAGYPEKLPDSSTTILANTVKDTMDARQSNINAWNDLAQRFDNYMLAKTTNDELDEQIEALVARYEYEWRELTEAQKHELMTLYHLARRLPNYGWPYTDRGWQKMAADSSEEEWSDLQKEMRLRAKPSTWIPTRRNIPEEETKKWMTFYSLHRIDVRTFWLSMNLMLDRVRMEALPLAVLPEPATFDALEPAKTAFDGFPAFDHFMRSQLYTMGDQPIRQNMNTTLWQDLYLAWLPLLLMRLDIDRWDMQQFQENEDLVHRMQVWYFGLLQLGYGRLASDVYKLDASGDYVMTERIGEGIAVMPFWISGSGEAFINGQRQEISAACSPWLFGDFEFGTQRMKYAGPYALIYHGGYDIRPEKPYVHSFGLGALWLSAGDAKHQNTRHGPLWGIIGFGRSKNRPAIYLLWQGIPLGPEKAAAEAE